ncbi:HisA/HisF-related TIM barrel protein [Methylomonas sp. MgM2]
MQIIPVIDLKDGLVVHAVRGDRANYQAVHHHSILTDSSDINAVLAGFLALHPFKRFYIADLNAINGLGNHYPLIQSLARAHPSIEFWLDNGNQLSCIDKDRTNMTWVIGTESQQAPPCASNRDFILSLDFKNEQPAGLADWFNHTQFWPKDIIVMTLSRVGGNDGPDFGKLNELQQSHPHKRFIAAGGIRDHDDLLKLKRININAALSATALHTGAISEQEIQNLEAKNTPASRGVLTI